AMIIRNITWLWRTAYSCAILACSDWPGRRTRVSNLFDNYLPVFNTGAQLLELYTVHAAVEADQAVYVYLVNASFASASGR
ncbi:hypothetical protein P692DRAFT_20667858, partial [Suillus brevipes Sb2]